MASKRMNTKAKPALARQRRQKLMMQGSALAAAVAFSAFAADQARAQVAPPSHSVQGDGVFVAGSGTITTTATTPSAPNDFDGNVTLQDTVTVTTNSAIINWNAFDTRTTATTTAAIDWLPAGNGLLFVGPTGDYVVLNRIISTPNATTGDYRAIGINGYVTSRVGSSDGAIGGNVWFYAPGGFLIGSTARFNIGGLVLTSSDLNSIDKAGTELNFRGVSQEDSAVIIESGAVINALNDGSSYVAAFAPYVEQSGTVNVDGSAAYVGAEAGTLTISNGLFDIAVETGTADSTGVNHKGDTVGPASTGAADAQAVYMVAVPKNDALTMLVGGNVGYQAAASAAIENGRVVLSTGNVGVTGGATDAAPQLDTTVDGGPAGSIVVDSAIFGSTTDIFAEDTVKLVAGTTLASNVIANSGVGTQDLNVTAGNTISITATQAGSVGATGDVNLRAGVGSATGGTVDINLDQVGFTDTVITGLLVGGDLNIDVSAAGADDFFIIRNNGNTGIGEDAVAGSINIDVNNGGDLVVLGDVNLLAGAQGGKGETVNGAAAAGDIRFTTESGGRVDITGNLTIDAEALSAQAGKIGGNGPGGLGSKSIGGNVDLNIAGASFSAGAVDINTSATASSGSDDTIAQNNDAAAGDVGISITSGGASLGSLAITADSTAVDSFDGKGLTFDGAAGRATVGIDISGDAVLLDITGDLDVSAMTDGIALRPSGAAISLSATNTGASGGLSVGGSTTLDSRHAGGSETELNLGGAVTLAADNAGLAVGNLFVATDSSPSGSFSGAFGNGQDFQGGDVGLTAINGGSITGGFMSISATGIGAADSAGDGTGGRVSLLANDGTIQFTGSSFIDTSGSGGVGIGDGGVRDLGVGQGGAISFTVRGTSGLLDFTNMFFTSDGQIQFDVEFGSGDFEGDGGSGNAGAITFNIEGGNFNANSVFVSADGTGGSGGDISSTPSLMTMSTGPIPLGGPSIVSLAAPSLLSTATMGASPGPVSGGATQAGAGGDGIGGDVTFNLTAGTMTVNSLTISADGVGGSGGFGDVNNGTFGGDGGLGQGGSATFNAIDGTLNVTNTLTVSGAGIGGSGGFGSGADGGNGGDAIGGSALFNLDGTASISANAIVVAADASGGFGGSTSSSGVNPGGVGGVGGDATAGIATFDNISGSISFNTLTVRSNGTGGSGGDAFGQGTGLADNAGGAGGQGTGGTAIINLNQDDGSDPTYIVQALGTGGGGGQGLDGGNGGAAQGGTAQLNVNDANVNLTTATVSATATGGTGGFVDGNNGFGGNGGNAVGGTAQLDVNGLNAQLTSDSPLLVTSQGIGGAGAAGGSNPLDSGITGDGGAGGSGTGGTVRVIARDGASLAYTADGTTSAAGFGGAGGDGGDAPSFTAGNGGVGGAGTGGTIEFQALTGGQLVADGNGSGSTLDASGTGGLGGDGGAGASATDGDPGAAGALTGGTVSLVADGTGPTLLSANAPSILNFTDTVTIDVSAIGAQDFRTNALGADATGGTGTLSVSNGGNLLFTDTVTINANAQASIGELTVGTSTGGTININVADAGSDLTILGITPNSGTSALRNRSFIGLASAYDPQTGSNQFLNATGGDSVGGNLNITMSGGTSSLVGSAYLRGDAGRSEFSPGGAFVVNTANAAGGTINLDFTGGTHSVGGNGQWEFDLFTQAVGGAATPAIFDLLIDGADLTGTTFNVDAQTFGDVVNALAAPISVIIRNGGIADTVNIFYNANPADGGATVTGVGFDVLLDNGTLNNLVLESDVTEFSASYRTGSAHAIGGDFNVTVQNGSQLGFINLTSFNDGQLGALGSSATSGDMTVVIDNSTLTGDVFFTNYARGVRPNTNATAIDLFSQGGDMSFTLTGAAAVFTGDILFDHAADSTASNGLEDGDVLESFGGNYTINVAGGTWSGGSVSLFQNVTSARGFDNQPGGDAISGDFLFNQTGGTVDINGFFLNTGVGGGFGGDGLDAGAQIAGDITFDITAGSLTTGTLSLNSSSVFGFLGGGGDGVGSDGGNGGLGQAGAISIFNDGTGNVDLGDIAITAIGEGGFGGNGDIGFAGGDGGAGFGGDLTISNTGTGTFAASSLSIDAGGIGGAPGSGGDGGVGGTGGTGTGGTVTIDTVSEFVGLTAIDIAAVGTGGSNNFISTLRRNVTGTTGGTGQGGSIDFNITGTGTVLAALTSLTLDASGSGGAGGTGSRGDMLDNGGTGGTGGDGIGGSVALGIAGVGASLVFDPATFVLTSDGTGGTGGSGGDNLLTGTAGDGGTGGAGTGGAVILRAGSGSTLDVGSTGGTFTLSSSGTGGAGGTGGDYDMASGGLSGAGGDGGLGTGGSPTLRAVGGTIVGNNLQLVATGTGGVGGLGGGDGTVQFSPDGNGGTGAGGNPILEILDGSPGILDFNDVSIFANGVGGTGTLVGGTLGGRVDINDLSPDPLGVMTFNSLTVDATGDASVLNGGLFAIGASGAMAIAGDLVVDVAGDIQYDFDGDGQLVVGNNALLTAGGNIIVTHTNNLTPVNSFDIGLDLIASAGGNFDAGAGTILLATREVSITAQNIGFDAIEAGNDNIFDAGQVALTLNAVNGSITSGPTGSLTALGGMDLDATQAISFGDMLVNDGPITIDAGTTLTTGDITITQGGFVSNESIAINSGSDALLGNVAAIDGLTITSGGGLTATSLRATGITATASGAVDIGDATIFDGVAGGGGITISGTSIVLDSADASTGVGNDIALDATAGDAILGIINSEAFLDVTATGNISFDTLTATGVYLTSGGDVTGTFASSDRNVNTGRARDVQITAPGAVVVTSFDTVNDVQVTAASFDTDSVVTGAGITGNGSHLIVNVTGDATVRSADVGGLIDIDAASISLGAIAVAAATTLDSTSGDISITSIVTDSNVVANSAGDILLGSSEKRGTDTLGNESMTYNAAGDVIVSGVIDTHDSIFLTAGGLVDTQQLIAFDNVNVTAGTTVDILGITTTNGGSATIDGTVITLGASTLDGGLTTNASAGDLTITGDVTGTGLFDLDATGNVGFQSLTTGSQVQVNAGGDITGVSSLKTGTDSLGNESMSFTAGGAVTLTGTVDTHDNIVVSAGTAADLNQLTAFDNVTVTAGTTATIANITTTNGGNASITAQSIALDGASINGALSANATAGSVNLNGPITTQGATLTATADILFTSISSEGNQVFTAGGNVTGADITGGTNDNGGDNVTINADGDVTITGTISALDALNVTALGAANIANAITTMGGAANLTGGTLTLGSGDFSGAVTLTSTTGDVVLNSDLSTGNTTTITSAQDILFGTVTSSNGNLNLDAARDVIGTSVINSAPVGSGGLDRAVVNAGNDIVLTGTAQSVDDGVFLTATNNIDVGTIDAADTISAIAGGALVVGTATNANAFAATLQGTSVSLDSGSIFADLIVNATAGDIAGTGTITVGGAIDLDATGNIGFGSLSAGGAFNADTTGGDITFTAASAVLNLVFNAANAITGGAVTSDTRSVTLTAPTIAVGDVTAANDVLLTSTAGGIGTGNVLGGNNVLINSAADIAAGDVRSTGGRVNLAAVTGMTLGAVTTVDTDITLDAGGDVGFGSIAGGRIVDIQTTGTVSGGDVTSQFDLTIDGAAIDIGTATSVVNGVTLTATGDIGAVGLSTPGNALVTAGGAAVVGNADSGGFTTITGTSVTLDSGTIGNSLALNATAGDINGTGAITVGAGIDLDATGNVTFGSLTAQGDTFDVNAGGDITFDGAFSPTDDLLLTAGGTILGGDLSAGLSAILNANQITIGDGTASIIDFTSANDILFNSLTSPNAITLNAANGTIGANTGAGDIDSGGDVTLLAQDFALNDVTALGSVDATASQGDATFGTVDATGNITISAAGTPTVANAISGGNTSITGQSVTFNNGTVGGDLSLTATNGGIDGNGTVSVGGGIAMTATGNVGFGSLEAQGGSFVVDAGGNILFSGATSTDFVDITAVGSITGGDLTATNALSLTGGSIAIGDASAANISLLSGSDILFNLLTSPNAIALMAANGTIGANTGAGDIDSGGDVTLLGIAIDLNDITAGGGVGATATQGDLDFGTILASGDVAFDASGSAFVDHLETTGSFTATTGGNFGTGPNSVITGGDIVVNSALLVDLGNSSAGGLIDVTGQQIDFDTLVAGTSATLETNFNNTAVGIVGNGNITGNSIDAGGAIAITAAGSTSIANGANAGDSLTVTSAGDSLVSFAGSITDTTISGQSVLLNDASVGGDLTVDAVNGSITGSGTGDVGGSIAMTATGDVSFGGFTAQTGGFTVDAGGNINFAGATAGDAIDMTAPGAINGGDLSAGSSLTLDGGLIAIGDASATDISLTSATDILFNLLTSPNAIILSALNGTIGNNGGAGDIDSGDDVTLDAQVLALNDVTSGGNVSATASTGDATFGTIDAAGNIVLSAAGTPTLGNAISGGDTSVTGQSVIFDNGTVGGALRLNATAGDIDGRGTVSVGGAIDFDASGDVTFGSLDAGDAFTVDAGGAIAFDRATSPVSLAMNAGGAITGGDLDVAGALSLDGATIAIGDAVADSMAITSNADILFNSLIVRGPLSLSAATGTIGANTGAGDIQADSDVTLDAQVLALNDVTSAGSVSATASTGDATFGTIDAASNITVAAAGTPTIGNAISGGDTSITGQSVAFDNGTVGGNLALTATAGDIASNGTVDVAGGIALDASGDIGFGSLDAQGGDFNATAGGEIAFGQASATGRLDLLSQGGDGVTGSDIAAGGEVEIDALTGSLSAGNIAAGGGVDIGALGQVSLMDVTLTGGGADIAAGGDIAVGSITGADTAGIFLTSGMGGVSFTDLQASGGIGILGDGGLVVGNSIVSGDEVSVDGDVVQLGSVQSGNDFFGISEVGDFTIGSAQSDGEIFLISQGLLDAGPLAAVTDITAQAGSFAGTTLDAGGDITVTTSAGNIDFTRATAGGSVAMTAADDIGTSGGTRGDITAGLNIDLAGSDMRLNDLVAGGAITIAASQTFLANSITAGGNVSAVADLGFDVFDGGIQSGADIAVDSAGRVFLGDTTATGSITASGGSIDYASLAAGSTIGLAAVTPDPDAPSSGDITGGSTTAGAGLSQMSTVNGDILLSGPTNVDGDIALDAVGDVSLTGDANIAQGLTIGATGLVATGDATSGGAMSITAGSSVSAQDLTSGGLLSVTSGSGDIVAEVFTADGGIALDSGAAIDFLFADTFGEFSALAVGGITFRNVIADGAASFMSTGGGTILGSTIASDTSITASTAGAFDVLTLQPGVAGIGVPVMVTADAGIAIENLTASTGSLVAVNGPVSVSVDIDMTGPLTASGTSVLLRSTNDLVAQANASAGDVDIATTGMLELAGGSASQDILLSSGGDLLISDDTVAGRLLSLATDGLLEVNALAAGETVRGVSSDIAIGQDGSLGQTDLTGLIELSAEGDVVVGGDGSASGVWQLDNDEFSRVHSGGDITISTADSVELGDLDIMVIDNVSGAQSGNVGLAGTFSVFANDGIEITGDVVMTNATSDNAIDLATEGDIFLDAEAGLLEINQDSGIYTGSIFLSGANIYAMTRAAFDDIQGMTIDQVDERLADSDGLDNEDGVIRTGTLEIETFASDVFIQNTVPGTDFDERRGFTVDTLILSDPNDTQPIVINGVVGGATGVDTIGVTTIDSTFDPGSTINGCLIADPSSCSVVFESSFLFENPVQDLIEQEFERDDPRQDPKGEGVTGDGMDSFLVEIRDPTDYGEDPLIDDPVTGAGNEDLWTFDPEEETGEQCDPNDPNCELEPAE